MTNTVTVNAENIPDRFKQRERWLLWDNSADTPRRPHWRGDFGISWSDPDAWHSFEEALEAAQDHYSWGIGYVFQPGDDEYMIDIDGPYDGDGHPRKWIPDNGLNRFRTGGAYMEWSPSGNGIHIPIVGEIPEWWADCEVAPDKHQGVDTLTNKFCTFTGDRLEESGERVADVNAAPFLFNVYQNIRNDSPRIETDESDSDTREYDGGEWLTDDYVEAALGAIDPDIPHNEWIRLGYAVYDYDSTSTGKSLFKEWSQDGEKWDGAAKRSIDNIWSTGNTDIGVGTLIYEAKQAGWEVPTLTQTDGGAAAASAGGGGDSVLTPTGSGAPDRVESDLIDALLDDPERWIDPDTQTWTVRATDDHDADTIADAIAAGELPGDAWAALADAVLSGNIPSDIDGALKNWRQNPETWDVGIARSYSPTALSPGAIAADADVELAELGELKNNELAEHVWRRIREHDSHHFLTRHPDETLFAYDPETGTWDDIGEARARAIGYDALGTAFTQGVRRELVERIRATRSTWVDADDLGAPTETVPVANGLLQLDSRDLRNLTPDDHVLSRLPVEYDPDADCPLFKQYLKEVVPNHPDRHILQEYVGYCLMHWGLPFHKALFIVGPQSSGKSTFLTIVKRLLGGDATCSLAPQEFTEERFAGYDLVGSWANIRSDIPADLIENTGKFKEVVAGDPVKVERKYEDPVTVEPTAKHLFAANTLPSAEIEDSAFFRRILLVSFPDTIPRDNRDPKLGAKLQSELPGILNWALEGLDRLRDEGRFTGDYGPETVRETWETWGQSVARFKSRCLDTDDSGAREAKAVVYNAYTRFCKAEGIPAESKRKFTRELKKDGAIGDGARVTVDGERMRAYTGVELLDERVPAPPDTDGDDDLGHGLLGDY